MESKSEVSDQAMIYMVCVQIQTQHLTPLLSVSVLVWVLSEVDTLNPELWKGLELARSDLSSLTDENIFPSLAPGKAT